jgi:hypothetical protein
VIYAPHGFQKVSWLSVEIGSPDDHFVVFSLIHSNGFLNMGMCKLDITRTGLINNSHPGIGRRETLNKVLVVHLDGFLTLYLVNLLTVQNVAGEPPVIDREVRGIKLNSGIEFHAHHQHGAKRVAS